MLFYHALRIKCTFIAPNILAFDNLEVYSMHLGKLSIALAIVIQWVLEIFKLFPIHIVSLC